MAQIANGKYNAYKFNYNFLKDIAHYIGCLSDSFWVHNFLRTHKNIDLDQFNKILWVIIDLLISADKALNDNNLASFVASSSMANEYMLKFSLIFSNYKKNKKAVKINILFHDWKNINIWKLPEKAINNIDKSILNKVKLDKNIQNNDLFNDFKHLNNIDVIHFHNTFAKGVRENIDGHNTWVDENAYHFGIMEILFETLLIIMLNCYTHHPEQLTSSDYLDHLELGLTPQLNSQHVAAPWFVKYLDSQLENTKKLKRTLLNGQYLNCFIPKK